MAAGVVPFMVLTEAITAVEAAALPAAVTQQPPLPGGALGLAETLSEHASKTELSNVGVPVPASLRLTSLEGLAAHLAKLRFPLALNAEGMAHKSDAGGVALGLMCAEEVQTAAEAMGGVSWLV